MAQSDFGPRLEIRQSQQLVMTAQLQQSIKLLQMSSQELAEFLSVEVERNPLLMIEESDEARDAAAREEQSSDTASSEEAGTTTKNDPTGADHTGGEDGGEDDSNPEAERGGNDQASDWLDAQDQDFWHGEAGEGDAGNPWDVTDSHAATGRLGRDEDSDAGSILEQTLRNDVSLQAHLLEQMPQALPGSAERLIAARLIEALDEAGYLQADLSEMAEALGTGIEQVESVLRRLQGLDPTGVFARSLAECLSLQLREKDRLDPAMQKLMDHLDLLGAGKMEALRRKCGVDAEDMAEMIAELKSLNPKPGLGFARDESQVAIPDVLVRRGAGKGSEDRRWIVELNAQTLPRLIVNRRYLAQLQGGLRPKNGIGHNSGQAEQAKLDRKYLTEQMQVANWLVKALDQRAQNLLKISTEIVAQQEGFFRQGVAHLKPMTLRAIADAVGVHESTVSRITTNKYIASNRGLFELKYFFSSALSSDEGGGDVSSRAVQHRIRAMIEAETLEKILSDDAIAEALQQGGINVARRTVAKYRDILRIPSSAERRRAYRRDA